MDLQISDNDSMENAILEQSQRLPEVVLMVESGDIDDAKALLLDIKDQLSNIYDYLDQLGGPQ